MNDDEFSKFTLDYNKKLTDPWREAELFWARTKIFRMKIEALSKNSDYKKEYITSSNAGKFAAYIGYVLARKNEYITLMAKLLSEVSKIYSLDFDNSNSHKTAIELMIGSIELTSKTDCSSVLVSRLCKLSDMILDEKWEPNLDDRIDALWVLNNQALKYCSKDIIQIDEVYNRIKKIESTFNEYGHEQIEQMIEQHKIQIDFNRREFDRLPFYADAVLTEEGQPDEKINISMCDMSKDGAKIFGNSERLKALVDKKIKLIIENRFELTAKGLGAEYPKPSIKDILPSNQNSHLRLSFLKNEKTKQNIINDVLYRRL